MNIKQALKEKNKLAKRVTDLMERVNKFNSVEEGAVRAYDPRETLDEAMIAVEELIEIKTEIHTANLHVYEKIFRMSEYKSIVKYLKTMNCSEGNVSTYRYGEGNTRKMTTVITEVERDQMIEKYENYIDSIQSELDSHNATTNI